MGRIVVTEFVSLDGVDGGRPAEARTSSTAGWSFEIDRGDEGDKFKLDETMASDALLLGRVTYEGFADVLALARGRVRRQVQRDAEVRRLLDARPTRSGPTRR